MAHMIMNNQIAWKGQKPWHGLGFEVTENATGAEMLTVAGLDWKVQRRAIAMRPADGNRSVMLIRDYLVAADPQRLGTINWQQEEEHR